MAWNRIGPTARAAPADSARTASSEPARAAAGPVPSRATPAAANAGNATAGPLRAAAEAALAEELRIGGIAARLTGPAARGLDVAAGDVLLVRVVTTGPPLEVALLEAAVPRAGLPEPSIETAHAAMRPDQLAMLRQVAVRSPDATALGESWRSMVFEGLERQAAAPPRTGAAAYLPVLPPPGDAPSAAAASGAAAAAPAWLMAAFAWAAPRLSFSVLATDADAGAARRRRRYALMLQFEMLLPAWGAVTVRLRLSATGLWLELAAERAEALPMLRSALPRLAEAVARADLRLVRCELRSGLPSVDGEVPGSAFGELMRNLAPATALSPALFRAAAELALALVAAPSPASSPSQVNLISPPSR